MEDPIVLDHWGIKEDFKAFIATAGLLKFSRHPWETYEEISREFLSTLRFEGPDNNKLGKKSKPPPPTFVIKFTMKEQRFVMSSAKLFVSRTHVVGMRFVLIRTKNLLLFGVVFL